MFPKWTPYGLCPSARKEVGIFFLKAICSKGVVLLAVDSEVSMRCGIRGLTRFIAQFIGMNLSGLCSRDLCPNSCSPTCFSGLGMLFYRGRHCCLYCQFWWVLCVCFSFRKGLFLDWYPWYKSDSPPLCLLASTSVLTRWLQWRPLGMSGIHHSAVT